MERILRRGIALADRFVDIDITTAHDLPGPWIPALCATFRLRQELFGSPQTHDKGIRLLEWKQLDVFEVLALKYGRLWAKEYMQRDSPTTILYIALLRNFKDICNLEDSLFEDRAPFPSSSSSKAGCPLIGV